MNPKIMQLLAQQHADDLKRSAARTGLSVSPLPRLIAAARRARS
jgi:hypothetical protein